MDFDRNKVSRKWIDLFETTTIYGEPSLSSKDELIEFEAYSKIRLPQEFKSFCQLFGSGQFGSSHVFIDCPRKDYIDYHEEKVERREIILIDIEESSENYNFLQHSYPVGTGVNDTHILFDLTSYQESDQSYDIYLFNELDKCKYHFGRSFFEFIVDVCLEKRVFSDILLEQEYPSDDPMKQKAFRCY